MKLDRITAVWERLGRYQAPFVITVAGTNGKGSCVAMLESVLLAAGKKTGSYTSPHLVRYNERFCVGGVQATDRQIIRAFCEIETARGDTPLTYFEYSTLCAIVIFHHASVQACILETGMGGRLDAVNMLENNIALITSIGLDHQQWLGDTREKIAAEKAGVFKQNGLAVCAEPDPPAEIRQGADAVNATLVQVGTDFQVDNESEFGLYRFEASHPLIPASWSLLTSLSMPLSGSHQSRNLAGVIAVLALTRDLTGVTADYLIQGLAQAKVAARCEVIQRRPLTILDVAHNADSAVELAEFLRTNQTGGKTRAVVGVLEDKELNLIFTPISGEVDDWYLATLTGDRGQSASELSGKLLKILPEAKVRTYATPPEAFVAAQQDSVAEDRLVAFGSFFTVGDILQHLESEGQVE